MMSACSIPQHVHTAVHSTHMTAPLGAQTLVATEQTLGKRMRAAASGVAEFLDTQRLRLLRLTAV